MWTTTSIPRLCLYVYIFLSSIQLLLAHEHNDHALSAAKGGAMAMGEAMQPDDKKATRQAQAQAIKHQTQQQVKKQSQDQMKDENTR